MTVQNPAIFLAGEEHPAEDFRRLITALVGGRQGFLTTEDMKVTARPTPNMSVDVAGGSAFINGTLATYQGTYFVENRGTTNLPIQASDALDRVDRVVAVVKDPAYDGLEPSAEWALEVITGAPSATPVVPALPDNALSLATIYVAAGASVITNDDITDDRLNATQHVLTTGTIVCTSSTRPSSPAVGTEIYESNTRRRYVWTGSAWEPASGRYMMTGSNSTTTPLAGGSGTTLITVNVPVIQGRTYRLVANATAQSSNATLGLTQYRIQDSSDLLRSFRITHTTSGGPGRSSGAAEVAYTATATETKAFYLVGISESGTSSHYSGFLMVYDEGR